MNSVVLMILECQEGEEFEELEASPIAQAMLYSMPEGQKTWNKTLGIVPRQLDGVKAHVNKSLPPQIKNSFFF